MEENNEELLARAGRSFRLGLLRWRSAPDGEGAQAVARHWQEALDLYRRAGDFSKAAEIEAALSRLGSKMAGLPKRLKSADDDDGSGTGTGSGFWGRGPLRRNFRDWHVFFTIGCFGFGGPFAVWSLMQDELVNRRKVLTNRDFLEAGVLGDILPGPVTMNIVTYTGYRLSAWRGAIAGTFLFILPSFLLMLFIAMHYDQYIGIPWVKNVFHAMGAAVTGIIISIGINLTRDQVRSYTETGIFIWAFVSSLVFRFDMIAVIFLAGFAGILLEAVNPRAVPAAKGRAC